ncbi:RagB/SusD family nutrient uptake outer membrane protein [uncultured Alistipes sp.]|uniref:RagB/SusD family nutrient uptake outer membrane protein n=1 Tax=uncultured Alistipes sp. TaxID=538949 RepID=UPI00260445C1|nr:RagB/SusD family nutrient uptake outer membrane protein [uncultured Alistipes sp.]
MKRIFLYFALLGALAGLGSCLDEVPYGTYSNQTFYNTEADAESALMYAYVPLNYIDYCGRFLFYLSDVPTNQYKSYGKADESPLFQWDITPTSDEAIYFFKSAYVSLARTNSVLDNVAQMSNISTTARNKILGEAHFLRAFNHFMLVINYGSVPIRSKTVSTTSDAFKDFSPIQDVYAFIIGELEDAIDLLPVNKVQGRADKVAAQALLARVYLYLASSKASGAPGYDWVSDADEMYRLAAQYAGDVLDKQTVYRLDPDLGNVYDVEHQADGVEHIFMTSMNREASGMEGTYSQLPQMFCIQTGSIVYISASLGENSREVMKFMDYESGYQVMRVDNDFRETYDDDDLRKQLMVTTIYNEDGSVLATYDPSNLTSSDNIKNKFFYPFCRKYTDPKSKSNRTSANLYLIRFAEVALTYAEAAGPTEEGYRWVNEVRRRAGLDALPEGLSIEDFREAVIGERTKELAFEGHGIYDLRRLNRVDEQHITNKAFKPTYAYFYPAPQRELDLNPQK